MLPSNFLNNHEFYDLLFNLYEYVAKSGIYFQVCQKSTTFASQNKQKRVIYTIEDTFYR